MKLHQLLLTCLLLFSTVLTAGQPVHKMGWKSNPNHKKGLKQFVHNPTYAAPILSKTDLRTTGHMPEVYDQAQIGSCTAQALVAAFEFTFHRVNGRFMNGSRLGLYYDERVHDGSVLQDAGSTTASGLFVLAGGGLGTEKTWPYTPAKFAQKPPAAYYKEAKEYVTLNAYDVDNTDGKSIRVALSAGYPVAFGGYVYQAIEELTAKDFFLPMPKGRSVGGHEELIVGHDDTLVHVYKDGTRIKGFYLIRNSWGKGFANGGYFWAPKAYIEGKRWNEDFAVIQLTSSKR